MEGFDFGHWILNWNAVPQKMDKILHESGTLYWLSLGKWCLDQIQCRKTIKKNHR